MQARQAIDRPLSPEDIAGAVAFLATDAAGAITGQTLCADGGRLVTPRGACVELGAVGDQVGAEPPIGVPARAGSPPAAGSSHRSGTGPRAA